MKSLHNFCQACSIFRFFQSCNPRHPEYPKTRIICHQESINDTMTEYSWRVAAPSVNGISNELHDVKRNTFFTKTSGIALDSIYFGPGEYLIQSNLHITEPLNDGYLPVTDFRQFRQFHYVG